MEVKTLSPSPFFSVSSSLSLSLSLATEGGKEEGREERKGRRIERHLEKVHKDLLRPRFYSDADLK